jgi:hypothetical protein
VKKSDWLAFALLPHFGLAVALIMISLAARW